MLESLTNIIRYSYKQDLQCNAHPLPSIVGKIRQKAPLEHITTIMDLYH